MKFENKEVEFRFREIEIEMLEKQAEREMVERQKLFYILGIILIFSLTICCTYGL